MAVFGGRGWGPFRQLEPSFVSQAKRQTWDPEKSNKVLKILFFVAVSTNAIFLLFQPLVRPTGAVRTEKTWPFSSLKCITNAEKVDFPGPGGRSG